MRRAWLLVVLLAGTAYAQTTRPTTMPILAQGLRAAAEMLALRQEVTSMRGRIAELEAEVQQLREKLAVKVKAEVDMPAKEVAKAEAKKKEPSAAIRLAIKEHRLAIGMTLEEAESAIGHGRPVAEYAGPAGPAANYVWKVSRENGRDGTIMAVFKDGCIEWYTQF